MPEIMPEMPDASAAPFVPEWLGRTLEAVGVSVSTLSAWKSHRSAQQAKEHAEKTQMRADLDDLQIRMSAAENTISRNQRDVINRIGDSEVAIMSEIRALRRGGTD